MNEKDLSYVEVDRNLIVNASIGDAEVELYDVRKPPFAVYGTCNDSGEGWFLRMPEEAATSVSEGVCRLSRESTGVRVRFSTDSEYIALRADMAAVAYAPHITLIEAGAFDLYVDGDGGSRLEKPFIPPYGMKDGYEQIIRFRTAEMRNITVNFPVHALVKSVFIGIRPGSRLGAGKPYRNRKPVVFYGSSVTHGTGSSRAGLTYPNVLSRQLNIHVVNLGFSGMAKGEPTMADYIAGMEMSAFVLDYDHNAPTPEHLEATHKPFFERIRAAHPQLPVIMLSRPNIFPESRTAMRQRDIIYATYRDAMEKGDQNVYFADGSEFLKPFGYDDCILDGVHPNDLGYRAMAAAIRPFLEKIIAESNDFAK